MIRICFWATSFQSDVLSLAVFLDASENFDVIVALDDPLSYKKEVIGSVYPFSGKMIDRRDKRSLKQIKNFQPDITIVDNHFPPRKLSPCLFVLWHGFGWKGPNDIPEFRQVHRSIKRLTGRSGMVPNPRFRWQCYGRTDLEHRNAVSGFARENLLSLGAAMSDDLVVEKISREYVLDCYPDDFRNKKIALLAFTWHYGSVFSHWGDDAQIMREIVESLNRKGYAVILRLHDRHRYEEEYLHSLYSLADDYKTVLLKFKDNSHDSLLDILISDLIVSNYSSILNYFYFTGRPSIHVYPVDPQHEGFVWRTVSRKGIKKRVVDSIDYIWKLSPEENGGLMVNSFSEFNDAIEKVADDADCCREKSADFIRKHMEPGDGRRCQAIAAALMDMV